MGGRGSKSTRAGGGGAAEAPPGATPDEIKEVGELSGIAQEANIKNGGLLAKASRSNSFKNVDKMGDQAAANNVKAQNAAERAESIASRTKDPVAMERASAARADANFAGQKTAEIRSMASFLAMRRANGG